MLHVQWHLKPEAGHLICETKESKGSKIQKFQIFDLDQGAITAALARFHTLSKHISWAEVNACIQ
jgi:hypothetical protein